MQAASLGVTISFTAGLLSFLSPCVLPLIPSYVSFITGLSLEDVQRSRRVAVIHSLLFILGFTLIFLALGATATVLGRLLLRHRDWVGRVGGVLVIVLGLYLLGVFNVGVLARERRVHIADKPLGYLGTVLVGMAFAAGWTPCIGPILAAILSIAAAEATVTKGAGLLAVYSAGLGIPFLLAAFMIEQFSSLFARMKRHLHNVERAMGVLMVITGIGFLTGAVSNISIWLLETFPALQNFG